MSGLPWGGIFRATTDRWMAKADRLDRWATAQETEVGGQETFLTANARFSAAWYRFAAAVLGWTERARP